MFEIDIVKIAKRVYEQRMFVVKYLVFSLIVCLLFLLVKPATYISTTTFAPQRTTSTLSNLFSLGSFVGISLADMSTLGDGILPLSYPKIVYSSQFLKDLMHEKIPVNGGADTTTIMDFIVNPKYLTWQERCYRYTFGFISYIDEKKYINEFPGSSLDTLSIRLTEEEQFCANRLRKMIQFEVYEKKPTIDFKVEMTNPEVAASCSTIGYQLLVKNLLRFAQDKKDKRILLVDSLLAQAKIIKDQKHNDLAVKMDENRDLVSFVARSKIEKLQNEYMIANNFYNEMSRERMLLLYKNVEDPLLLISHAYIIDESSNPKYFHVIFLFAFFGILFGSIRAYYAR